MIKIAQVRAATKEDLVAVNRLLSQLSGSARRLDMRTYKRLLANRNYFLIAARDGRRMIGMGSLMLMEIPVAFRTRMEDVVVDESYRGQGIGKKISRAMIDLAKKKGGVSVDLTTRPHRNAAKLYESLGFELRETNTYRLKLK